MIRRVEVGEKWECFKKVKNPIKELWLDGEFGVKDLPNCVAVVGSRRISSYGRQVVEKLVGQLVTAGKMIVSGFMYGTDQAAHRAALEAGGRTVAVLGWGIRYEKMEEEDRKLWKKIVDSGGAVISEWEQQTPAYWTFPARDRVMAAISTDVYVVEAAVKSGALITAEIALGLGRAVWAVPGPVFSPVSAGTNRLIADGKAKMWLPIQQAGFDLGLQRSSKDMDVYSVLQNEILTADEVAKKLDKPIAEVLQELMMLTLEGKVVEKEGKYQIIK